MKKTAFIFSLLFIHFSIIAQVNIGDSIALVNLYNSTNGTSWKNNNNWLNGRVSEWFGVTVTDNRVTGLSLVDNQLSGTLPTSLGNLTAIRYIYLSGNNINGPIPNSIGNLSALISFYLNNNKIEGDIPSILGNITSLKEIHLEYNKLTGEIPVTLRNLGNLDELILAYNQLTGSIPGELGDLQVQKLELNNNQLSGSIPARLRIIRNLTILKLNNNELTGEIPTGLAPIICYLFDLSSNNLTGGIPSDLGSNSTLAHVNLSNNALTGQIPSLSEMSALQSLQLDSNQLTGSIPSSFSNLKRLMHLNLMNNQLSGSIPDGLCSLPDLQFLQLSNNQFTFDGMECVGQKVILSMFADYTYPNQKKLTLNYKNSKLSLTAGGNLANNTYYIYKDSVLLETLKGDSAFQVAEGGKYWVEVTNDLADQLTLYSNQLDVSSNIILPLNWLDFTVVNCSDNICLRWLTENEQNTSHFEIERSTDGKNFEQIGTRVSANTPGKHSYDATDYSPAHGINFYRIKQVDADGMFTYSDVVSAKISVKGVLTIAPNPANNFIKLRGIVKAEKVIIYSTTGQIFKQWQNVNGDQELNIANLQQGVYMLKVQYNKKETIHKLIKL
ncbi:T9SS type A sorting domain-containing protein [Agriterribacter humi]|uniref:T9SS type A sorting domain-containing protein n=1 Tax=Agriterribacter humi TaxID=1104781 RepID=UPI001264CFB0|nr:T9SS type A sorting domain-containing protein [Agriterribacter humi]